MKGDMLALRQFVRTSLWAAHPSWLAELHEGVISERLDGLVWRDGLQAAAALRRTGANARSGSIGVLPIVGPITSRPSIFSEFFGGAVISDLQAQFRELSADDTAKAILMVCDSPGGTVDLVPEFADELSASPKPLIAVISTMAASAAYWLASQADTITITPSGGAGSIGVFMLHMDHSRQVEAAGITPTFISAGTGKTDGNPFQPLAASARAVLQARVDYTYGQFAAAVGRGRRMPTARVAGIGAKYANAPDAVELGLADRIGTLENALAAQAFSGGPSWKAIAGRTDEAQSTLIAVMAAMLDAQRALHL